MALEHVTTNELVEALMTRPHVRALLVWQPIDAAESDWRWRSQNCNGAAVAQQVAEFLNRPQAEAVAPEPAEAPAPVTLDDVATEPANGEG